MSIYNNPDSNIEERRLHKWINSLGDYDTAVASSAAEKLGRLGNPQAVPALVEAMRTRVTIVSAAAAAALGVIRDRSAVPALIETVRNHNDPVVRTAAIKSLGEIGDPKAVPALSQTIDEYLRSSNGDRLTAIRGYNYALLTTAVYALRLIGTPEALRAARKADHI